MSLRSQITDAMKDAMRAKEEATLGAVRLIMADLKKRDIDARPRGLTDGIPDEEILGMMQGMIKQRRESIALYKKGNRPDLVKQESDEIAVIERFLPKQMGEADVKAAIEKAITAVGAASIKDMGKVMAEMKKTYAGQMDFASASNSVKTILSARG
jgi:uncharacterized protein YqeY